MAVIVGLIILTFALWGIQSYLNAEQVVIVAEVNGEEIGLREYQNTFQRFRQRAQAEFGAAFDESIWSTPETKRRALDFVVDERALDQNIVAANMRVTDAQVVRAIRSSQNFVVDGEFSRERYAQIIDMLGFSELGFEHQTRRELAVQQLRTAVAGSAFVTTAEAKRLEQLRAQQRSFGYALIDAHKYNDEIVITDAELESYFAEREQDYKTEEQVKLEYLILSLDELTQQVPITEDLLRDYYASHKAQYEVEEERSANHVLIQVAREVSPQDDAAALEKARVLRQLIVDGDAIEDIAREHSDDIGSRAEGGETGFFGRGAMVPEFEEAVFAMQPGEISGPIRTQFGYHIIQLREIKPGGLREFDEVRSEVEEALRLEQAEALFFERAERFSDVVYEFPDSLQHAADELGLEVKQTQLLSSEGLAREFSQAVVNAAFDVEVLTEGLVSPPVELPGSRVIAVRVLEHNPSRLRTLNEVREAVANTLRAQKSQARVASEGARVLERLNAGEALEQVVAEGGLEWHVVENATRLSADASRAILRLVFSTPPVTEGKASYAGNIMGNGDYGVVAVTAIHTPAESEIADDAVTTMRTNITRNRAQVGWRSFVAALRERADIATYPDRL